MEDTQWGDFDDLDDLLGLPLVYPQATAAPLPAPPPHPDHPPPPAQDDCIAPAAATSAVVAPGWKDITERAAENIDTRQRAPVRKGVTRPFPGFTPARGKTEGETWREYLLNVYAECLHEDPKPDPEGAGCSLNYGKEKNGCMARVCVACRWMKEKNLGAHLASDKHQHKVEMHKLEGQKRELEEAAEGERQKRQRAEGTIYAKKMELIKTEGPGVLEHEPQEVRGNRNFMLAAVALHGCALKYASEELQKEREVVLTAVTQDGKAMQFASRELSLEERDQEYINDIFRGKHDTALGINPSELRASLAPTSATVTYDEAERHYSQMTMEQLSTRALEIGVTSISREGLMTIAGTATDRKDALIKLIIQKSAENIGTLRGE